MPTGTGMTADSATLDSDDFPSPCPPLTATLVRNLLRFPGLHHASQQIRATKPLCRKTKSRRAQAISILDEAGRKRIFDASPR